MRTPPSAGETEVRMIERAVQCRSCRHFHGEGSPPGCAAFGGFKGGIPEAIWLGRHDHTAPYPGDGGIRYEPLAE